MNGDTAFAESFGQFSRGFFIFVRQDMRQHFNHMHVHAVATPNRGKLDANCAATNNHRAFRELIQHNCLRVIEHFLAIRFHPWDDHSVRTGR